MTLALVCTHWRAVALGYPMLWSNIYVSLKTDISSVQAQLARSAQLPLSLTIRTMHYQPHSSPIYCPKRLIEIWNTILPHISRWRTLDIQCDDSRVIEFISSCLHQHPPLTLHQLSLVFVSPRHRIHTPYSLEGLPIIEQLLPALNRVRLIMFPLCPPVLTNLTHLTLGYGQACTRPNWQNLVTVLRKNPRLQSLSFSVGIALGSGWTLDEAVVFEHLQSLSLHNVAPGEVRSLFATLLPIHFPALNTLILDLPAYKGDNDISDYDGIFPLSGHPLSSQLQTLELHTLEVHLIHGFFNPFINLTTLLLDFRRGQLSDMFRYEVGNGFSDTLEQLRYITFWGVTLITIQELINRRIAKGMVVEQLTVHLHPDDLPLHRGCTQWLCDTVNHVDFVSSEG